MALIHGSDWSIDEVEACVSAYFENLAKQLSGENFVKAQIYRNLAEQTGRTAKSIEFKFQNISAVLNVLGREWMSGLAPLANYQELLALKVSEHIQQIDAIPFFQGKGLSAEGMEDAAAFFVEPPPELRKRADALPSYLVALIRKFDPVERDMRNRALGEAGEQFILNHEKRFLTHIDRPDLSEQVRWVSKEEGDGAGYDILSFTDRGEKKFLEVKTTVGGSRTPFFISRNEYAFAKRNQDNFSLMRLYDFRKTARAFELRGSLDEHVNLSTEVYRAEFQ